ncbi:hypothetical protein PR048_025000 [Dryococelus australis]|uniref:Uncharacterized protein n=1 Tax=Dryococelus australis TaxID=614101 RepID=A0ABQ9GQ49_9NEOP|nr:hypothetical protein PR048_025000 [Dryococelus australis]
MRGSTYGWPCKIKLPLLKSPDMVNKSAGWQVRRRREAAPAAGRDKNKLVVGGLLRGGGRSGSRNDPRESAPGKAERKTRFEALAARREDRFEERKRAGNIQEVVLGGGGGNTRATDLTHGGSVNPRKPSLLRAINSLGLRNYGSLAHYTISSDVCARPGDFLMFTFPVSLDCLYQRRMVLSHTLRFLLYTRHDCAAVKRLTRRGVRACSQRFQAHRLSRRTSNVIYTGKCSMSQRHIRQAFAQLNEIERGRIIDVQEGEGTGGYTHLSRRLRSTPVDHQLGRSSHSAAGCKHFTGVSAHHTGTCHGSWGYAFVHQYPAQADIRASAGTGSTAACGLAISGLQTAYCPNKRLPLDEMPFPTIPAPHCEVLRANEGEVMSMEQCRNERAGEPGDPRENPPTSSIDRHYSHMRASGSEQANRSATAAPRSLETEPVAQRNSNVEQNRPCPIVRNHSNIVYSLGEISGNHGNRNQDDRTVIKTQALKIRVRRFSTTATRSAPTSISTWATVAEWLDCSPPTEANRVQCAAGSLRIFASGNHAGRCRWSADFLGDFPFTPPPLFIPALLYPHFTLIGSQDLVVKRRPNISTHAISTLFFTCDGRIHDGVKEETKQVFLKLLLLEVTLTWIRREVDDAERSQLFYWETLVPNKNVPRLDRLNSAACYTDHWQQKVSCTEVDYAVPFQSYRFMFRWIGRGDPVPWPARSPDLSPLDCFFWCCLKDKVYIGWRSDTRDQLLQAITDATNQLRIELAGMQWQHAMVGYNVSQYAYSQMVHILNSSMTRHYAASSSEIITQVPVQIIEDVNTANGISFKSFGNMRLDTCQIRLSIATEITTNYEARRGRPTHTNTQSARLCSSHNTLPAISTVRQHNHAQLDPIPTSVTKYALILIPLPSAHETLAQAHRCARGLYHTLAHIAILVKVAVWLDVFARLSSRSVNAIRAT